MTFFVAPVDAPVTLPEGDRTTQSVYTGTACLALMDSAVTSQVWEDILYDGHDHEHGAGGLMLNSSAVGTHLEHDGDFPVELVTNSDGHVLGFRVNLDPYAEDLSDVRGLDAHGEDHGHPHSHGEGHEHVHPHSHDHGHDHDHSHDDDHDHNHGAGHGHGHGDGWSSPEKVRLVSASAVFGDPAGLPEADDTGDLIELIFPAEAGELSLTVYSEHGMRREVVAVWNP
jgi:hypothetical protein